MKDTATSLPSTEYLRIFWMLLRRDLKVLKKRIGSMLIDGTILVITLVVIFGSLFPLLGMSQSLIAPIYLGNVVAFTLFFGYSYGLKIVFDLHYNRFIDYQLTLPLPKRWLFAKIISYFIIEALLTTIPLMTLGIMLLGKKFTLVLPNWPLFALMYFSMLLFFSSFFVAISFWYNFFWFMENLWPRRLTLLFFLSTIFTPWHSIYHFSPTTAWVTLLNPLSYITEGLRATLLGSDLYLRPSICFPAIALFIVFNIWVLNLGIKKRLDPV